MKIAFYITKDNNTDEFANTIKDTILEIEPETEILEIHDRQLDQDNWQNPVPVVLWTQLSLLFFLHLIAPTRKTEGTGEGIQI